ncbi:MAG: luciferase family protein [Frankiales bacterium]|nr:luciferase family protein [Frankiales bacterium]
MKVDGNIGGAVDGTGGADLIGLNEQVAQARRVDLDGVWTTEVSRDPFLPLLLAAQQDPDLTVGTAVAVAFARNPMTTATVANDLQCFSQGRFVLGLGSQVEAHVTRRFDMPWSSPAERMRDFVLALRAIWASWQDGTPLEHRGEFYEHTLMPPLFRPPPHPYGPPPVVLAAVGPLMTRVAAEVADGLLLHGFTTPRYLDEVTLPAVAAGLTAAGRVADPFTVCYPGLVATGPDDASLERAVEAVRRQLSFYAATPAYRAVLDLHGWGDLHAELHRLARLGEWDTMASLVDDEVLDAFAVVGPPLEAGREVLRRFGGTVDRFTLFTPYGIDEASRRTVVDALHAGVPA